MNKNRHFIHIVINNKYRNDIYPNLPKYLIVYLINNPDKISFYLNKDIDINEILKQINLSDIDDKNVLKEIIKVIEVDRDLP